MVEVGEKSMQLALYTGPGERVTIGSSSQGEALRHPDALCREHPIELAERGVLAAYCRDVFQPEIAEPADIRLCRHRIHSHRERVSCAPNKVIRVDSDQPDRSNDGVASVAFHRRIWMPSSRDNFLSAIRWRNQRSVDHERRR